jgi:hypothetical protein
VCVSCFTLEEDSIVAGSPFLEEIEAAGLPVERWPSRITRRPRRTRKTRGTPNRLNTGGGVVGDADSKADAWLALRTSRTPCQDPRFSGLTGPREPETYAISYLERYLECPFKYFANRVLKLPE